MPRSVSWFVPMRAAGHRCALAWWAEGRAGLPSFLPACRESWVADEASWALRLDCRRADASTGPRLPAPAGGMRRGGTRSAGQGVWVVLLGCEQHLHTRHLCECALWLSSQPAHQVPSIADADALPALEEAEPVSFDPDTDPASLHCLLASCQRTLQRHMRGARRGARGGAQRDTQPAMDADAAEDPAWFMLDQHLRDVVYASLWAGECCVE